MLQEFITESIFPSHKSIISALRSAEIVGRGIVELSRNFRISEFPSFRVSEHQKNVGLNLPIVGRGIVDLSRNLRVSEHQKNVGP